ncbi:tRNA glutamyl-Q(34) synthetase GluQRS [Pseudoalteromonas sp. N1230-9]|uniref:tRNA glutamyl-Q(34) synthetase GluQRS n=1 Tax=unclassified Pseudoalteromonas TaxID=194690 RepID=UPI0010238B54|nr:tRNA glutamyl-Q(34) synthetase GluQRS [Pseudoalteromonas sp. CO302Y]RZG11414.1 tRNA glutamyl-Q(34) synthetase GluQRS [Pseudoalteromonas sp. CO133X]WOC25555.1 tRNA glutamyl-Q(34) synthetase GluQRS [Pseudoalteromonas sp. N1230-9]
MSTTAVNTQSRIYRGRFAPSPSGPLHFGSLIAAVGSFLDAKVNQGKWLVRIEDIDTTRVVPGASDDILRTLEAYGLHWDERVIYQTNRLQEYQSVLEQLIAQGLVYACHCTRKQVKAMGGIYQGQCKLKGHSFVNSALRLSQQFATSHYSDLIQGKVEVDQALAKEDYLIKRSDGLFAYQLVVVVDDIAQNISHVVRGADLLEPTARQLSLFKQLNQTAPQYAHLPLAVAKPGFKLSKQNYAPAISKTAPKPALFDAFRFLGLNPEAALLSATVEEMLKWAVAAYHLECVPKVKEIQVSEDPHSSFSKFQSITK